MTLKARENAFNIRSILLNDVERYWTMLTAGVSKRFQHNINIDSTSIQHH